MMQTHSLVQGSHEWLSHRAKHFNASDAAAMLGVSPYKTRSQLLHEIYTGLTADIDAATQSRFDDGHRFEALARPLAEKIICEDLYPVIGSEGKLSASFDGLTLDWLVCWEHKTLNDAIRAASCAAELSEYLRVQMEQQLMLSSANKCLFMASKWDGDTLIEEVHHWYEPDFELRQKIIQGWAQFAVDLENYVPEVKKVEAVGRSPDVLPALRIEVSGMVTASNLDAFKDHALNVFNSIKRDLETDQDFADAEKTVKWCGDIEDRLKAAKQHALSQTESIDALFRAIDDISAEARATRLELDKLVKARKDAIRLEIQQSTVAALRDHYTSLNRTLSGVGLGVPASFCYDVAAAMKGKKTIESLRDAASTILASAKIEANTTSNGILLNLNLLKQHSEFAFLFSDIQTIAFKPHDDFELLVTSRIEDQKHRQAAKLEAERVRIAEQERIKAEATVRAENEARRLADEQAERERLAQEAARTLPASTEPPSQSNEAVASSVLEGHPAWDMLPESAAVTPISAARPVSVPSGAPTLRLGQINERLGLGLTAEFLRTLGFAPAAKDKAALLFHESDFQPLCAALIRHITAARTKAAA